MLEVVAKLADKPSLDHGLIISLVIEYLDEFVWLDCLHHFLSTNAHIVLLLRSGDGAINSSEFF